MPPQIPDAMSSVGSYAVSSVQPIGAKRKAAEDPETVHTLFGDLPEAKRRKFILVDDSQRNTRVRVRVALDQVEMDEIPDSYRKVTSVYPRTYFPRQMQSPTDTPRNKRLYADDEDDGGSEQATVSRTTVPIPLLEGGRELPRMSWSQSRVFAGRILFLQKSLDAYRNKMRAVLMQNAQSAAESDNDGMHVAPQFLTRVGRSRWMDHSKKTKKEDDA